MGRRTAGVLTCVAIVLGTGGLACTGEDATMEVPEDTSAPCAVPMIRMRFDVGASADEVNRVHRATSDVDGVRQVVRADDEPGSAAVIEATYEGDRAGPLVSDVAASSDAIDEVETTCAGA